MTKRNLIITATIVVVVLATGFFYQSQKASKTKEEVKKTSVKKGLLKQSLVLSGDIDAREKVTLRFQSSGRLSSVAVKEGDMVKKGQHIASLDQRELKKQLQKDLNNFRSKRYDLDQQRDDYEGSAITDAMNRVLQKSQIGVDNAVLDVELQSIATQYANLSSPIEGIVTRVSSPVAGVNVTPSQAEFEIVNPESLYFQVTADQTEVTQLRRAMPANIILDAFPDLELLGEIKYLSFTPKAGETNTVYSVELAFNDLKSDLDLHLGMTGDAELIVKEKKNALYIPISYLKNDKDGDFVYMIISGEKQRIAVKTGMETDESVEILTGVQAGDTIYD